MIPDLRYWAISKELKILMINTLKDLAQKGTTCMNKWGISAER